MDHLEPWLRHYQLGDLWDTIYRMSHPPSANGLLHYNVTIASYTECYACGFLTHRRALINRHCLSCRATTCDKCGAVQTGWFHNGRRPEFWCSECISELCNRA